MNNKWLASDFWPTPENVFEEMYSQVDWTRVSSVLEPSAGKGDLVKRLESKLKGGYHQPVEIEAIEINPELRKTLSAEEISICGHDFLKFESDLSYDLIFMNPPFNRGADHLLHAIALQEKNGGQIVCLLNQETLHNAFSNKRKSLQSVLQDYNAIITYLGPAFIEAERPTTVNVVMVYIDIPAPEKQSFIFQEYKQNHLESESSIDPNDLIHSDPIQGAIEMYNFEVAMGTNLIKEYKRLQPYLKTNFEDEKRHEEYFSLKIGGKEASMRRFVYQVRAKYWRRFFKSDRLAAKLTDNLRCAYMDRIKTEFIHYEFNHENITIAQLEMAQNLNSGIKDTLIELFDDLTHKYSWYPECSKNIHYFNGWRTNNAFKVGPKVIIPLSGYYDLEYSWGGFRPTRDAVERKLGDIEKSLAFLDAEPYTEEKLQDMKDRLSDAEASKTTKNIPLRYFNVTFYKKGTCHIQFTNDEVLQRFNIFAAQHKGWLPPSYGKRSYQDMDQESQTVIKSFEGEESYKKVMQNPSHFIIDDTALLTG